MGNVNYRGEGERHDTQKSPRVSQCFALHLVRMMQSVIPGSGLELLA